MIELYLMNYTRTDVVVRLIEPRLELKGSYDVAKKNIYLV